MKKKLGLIFAFFLGLTLAACNEPKTHKVVYSEGVRLFKQGYVCRFGILYTTWETALIVNPDGQPRTCEIKLEVF